MALIKQVRYPIHRTLHETLGARHPSSVSPLGCQLLNQGMIATGNHYFERFAALCNTPGGSQGGTVRIRLGYHEAIGACRETPQSGPLGLPAPLSGALLVRVSNLP